MRKLSNAGIVVEVRREWHCFFVLDTGSERIDWVLFRRDAARLPFWLDVGQTVEVEGYEAEGQRRAVSVRLVRQRKWGRTARSARSILDDLDALLDDMARIFRFKGGGRNFSRWLKLANAG